MQFFWFLPTHGDGEYLGRAEPARHGFEYHAKLVRCLDRLGFDGVLVPTGQIFEEPWILAAALAARTSNLKFLVAIQPNAVAPAYAARQVVSFDRMSRGRIMLNVVVGASQADLANDGVRLSTQQRYQQADEFLQIYKTMLTTGRVEFAGKYYQLDGAELNFEPCQKPFPPLYSAGVSEAGLDLAAKHIDWYIMWADPVEVVVRRIAQLTARAKLLGRTVRFGIRVHFVVRDTAARAWDEAARLISRLTEQEIREAVRRFETEESSAQTISFARHRGDAGKLEIAPNLWAGVSLARGGALTALVGDPATVRRRLAEYAAAGVDLVIGSATPHLEEAEVVYRAVMQRP